VKVRDRTKATKAKILNTVRLSLMLPRDILEFLENTRDADAFVKKAIRAHLRRNGMGAYVDG
jgi:hypothetical protein